MKTTLPPDAVEPIVVRLNDAGREFESRYPGESGVRQAVHTVYGGAHLFRSDSAQKLGAVARRFMAEHVPDFGSLARALDLPGADLMPDTESGIAALEAALDAEDGREANPDAWFARTVHRRVAAKLETEPVEDFRIDFEDGYGPRPDDEEDACALTAADEVAKGMGEGILPPFIGIRIKPLTPALQARGLRTLDLFLTRLTEQTGGALPDNFVVTLPKVVTPDQVSALVDAFELIEANGPIADGALKLELMIETPQSIFDASGRTALPGLVDAARGRCVGAHFGVYDYTASLSITASQQRMRHAACDAARQMMQVALGGTGVHLSDGATNVVPTPLHAADPDGPPLTTQQSAENREQIFSAMRLHYDDVRHSLANAYYQGWDLHPAHLITRYAAVFAFFLESLDSATDRLAHFVENAALATLAGDVFDDAATGQGLLNFFLRGVNCGAITEEEALRTGLTLDELRTRSFAAILEGRG